MKLVDMGLTMSTTSWTNNMHPSMQIRMSSLPVSLATLFADTGVTSYAWYATEVLWSGLCSKTYKAPGDSDSD